MKFDLKLQLDMMKTVDGGDHWHMDKKYALRKDIYIPATLNGVDTEIHLMTSDGSIKDTKDKWYCSLECNRGKTYESCSKCEMDASDLALQLFPQLKKMGYPIALWSHGGFWTFNVFASSAIELPSKPSRRQLYYKMVHRIECPFHGKFIQETEECSL